MKRFMYKIIFRSEGIIGKLSIRFYFFLLKLFSDCKTCYDGYFFPHYGMAPHSHNLSKTGSFIGSTEIKDKPEWPDNFIEDKDAEGCGTYWCPNKKCNYARLD